MEDLIIEPSVDLLESMRSVGYSMESALADIIDNSIDAGASAVEIDIDVVNGAYIAILDNGDGMQANEAHEALRLAGTANTHSSEKLGRFGLGLKTASLSQGRRLTLVTKQGSALTALQWDIDYVRESRTWTLQVLANDEVGQLPLAEGLMASPNGTLVIWSKLDLLLGDTLQPGGFLAGRAKSVEQHLGLTFHQYLEHSRNRFSISINGLSVEAIDPFLSKNPKTQVSPKETIPIGDSTVTFQAFTLPHISGLSPQERSRPDLGEGMREAQGFYIYRNGRIISRGHWFGLTRMNELTKQTRVKVEVPRELDTLWQLDIKKSKTEPPASFKANLKDRIDLILEKGKRVHTFRGRKVYGDETVHLWDKIQDHSGFRYEVNLENPIVKATLSSLSSAQAESVSSLFQAIAAQYPFLDAYQEIAGNSSPQAGLNEELLREKLTEIRESRIFSDDPNDVFKVLNKTEPFTKLENLEALIQETWGASDGTNR